MYDNFTIEQVVDELKNVRDLKKDLDAKEKALKERILADGRDSIQGNNAKMTISLRVSETFNEDAFLEAFLKSNFSDSLKAYVVESKPVINQANLMEACKSGNIPLDYVKPFNETKESKVINVK